MGVGDGLGVGLWFVLCFIVVVFFILYYIPLFFSFLYYLTTVYASTRIAYYTEEDSIVL